MPDLSFDSIDNLIDYYEGNKNSLGSIAEVKDALEKAAHDLEIILTNKLIDYYNSYKPKQYQRTYNFLRSTREGRVQVNMDKMSIEVSFDESLATHPSIFGGEAGFVPILLNEGWRWSGPKRKNGPYHLAYYEGFHFIEKAIKEFNLTKNPYGFEVQKILLYHGKSV